MNNTSYTTDVAAWSIEQARLIRSGQFDKLDLENIAEEIEDVGKSEQRELASRLAVLFAHLLKWEFQADFRGSSWSATIREQKRQVLFHLDDVPSLRTKLDDARWMEMVWGRAKTFASKETGIGFDKFPESCPWAIAEVLESAWLPA
ncbi:DUF29 domain-containing protein [Actimicrobium sp. CCC2.4]|uniref:DUF29 domain-containing protein n=1 Tax=Actimicrobium sp. CCC2.4 TaxID=3048606 RepID=UPI002AC9DAA3|nr:DUF29 domain-containing protein [Actimicrobium sp. CCC2.4]MEB0135860.1 DUF29 domain-containing protein [Actimicrobium sp. CCC2.4]WPX33336.1 DUF29 domain-containing protein [Actimicrobium sp. CCC2.4]